VQGLRPDGYHDLESIFVGLAWGDTLWVERTLEEGGCTIGMDWSGLRESGSVPAEGAFPVDQNSVYRAVSRFREETGFQGGIRIRVEKRIPLGAGLGGGSSDAASTLLALRCLAAPELAQERLAEMALALGSDVPFFLQGGAAFVSGRGERIVPLEAPRGVAVVLVYPGFSSDTGAAFRLLDEARRESGAGIGGDGLELAAALAEHPGSWPYTNDFLRVFLEAGDTDRGRVYREVLEDLRSLGADFAGLSGAGSVCFGVFGEGSAAENAEQALSGRMARADQRYWVQKTFPLAYSGNGVVE
jgi:4-diphosphocytidyl-2-C-methyl-D-erythritol kinase